MKSHSIVGPASGSARRRTSNDGPTAPAPRCPRSLCRTSVQSLRPLWQRRTAICSTTTSVPRWAVPAETHRCRECRHTVASGEVTDVRLDEQGVVGEVSPWTSVRRSRSFPAAIPTAIASGVRKVVDRMRSFSCSSIERGDGWRMNHRGMQGRSRCRRWSDGGLLQSGCTSWGATPQGRRRPPRVIRGSGCSLLRRDRCGCRRVPSSASSASR
jgi:hypothetical protein